MIDISKALKKNKF